MKKLIITLVFATLGLCSAQLIIDLDESPDVFIPAPSLVRSSELGAYVKEDASNFAEYPQTITVTNTGTASDTTFTYTGMVEDRPAYGIGGTNYIYYLEIGEWKFVDF